MEHRDVERRPDAAASDAADAGLRGRAGAVKDAIDEAIRRAQPEGKTIGVNVDGAGRVTLRGTVGSWSERRQAENASWAVPGITSVDNQLRLTY